MAKRGHNAKRHAHDLIERLKPRQVSAVVGLMEVMVAPGVRGGREFPLDDEPLTAADRSAIAKSDAWFRKHKGIPQEEVMAEFGFTSADLRRNAKKRA